MDLTYINIQTLQSILDQLYPGAKAYGEPGGAEEALCGNDIVTIRRGLLDDIVRSQPGCLSTRWASRRCTRSWWPRL